jgi:flagellar hook-length control protein FliK
LPEAEAANDFRNGLTKAAKPADGLPDAVKTDASDLRDAVTNVRDALKVMEQINVRREYYQIPFLAQPEGPARQAELYIFKDKKPAGDANRTYSALIALDTAGLKHTEVYIQKTAGQASLFFRCDTDRALGVLSAARAKLTQALKEKNISVSGMSFNKITEPFLLTDPEPYTEQPRQESVKRFTFDMRI